MNSVTKLLLARARTVQTDSEVVSPCMSVCRMDAASGFCEGCMRTLDEIAAWGMMDNAAKRAVWALIEQRSDG